MKEELKALIKEWETDGQFLDNPHDSSLDRSVGQTYKECAKSLKEIIDRAEQACPTANGVEYKEEDVLLMVDALFHMFDSSHRQDAKEQAIEMMAKRKQL